MAVAAAGFADDVLVSIRGGKKLKTFRVLALSANWPTSIFSFCGWIILLSALGASIFLMRLSREVVLFIKSITEYTVKLAHTNATPKFKVRSLKCLSELLCILFSRKPLIMLNIFLLVLAT
jgi:hypothetical protein